MTEAALINVATLVRLGMDALRAHGVSEAELVAHIRPLTQRAIKQLQDMAAAH